MRLTPILPLQFVLRPGAGEGITLVDYDERWPEQFAELAGYLQQSLGSLAIGIEHVGSTAVPGMAAKPTLDIDVVIFSREELVSTVSRLRTLGYAHEGDRGVTGREVFSRRDEFVPITKENREWPDHDLCVCSRDSAELLWHLSFRNLLRKDAKLRRDYERLKRKLALRCRGDLEAFDTAKGKFVRSALDGSRRSWSLKDWVFGQRG